MKEIIERRYMKMKSTLFVIMAALLVTSLIAFGSVSALSLNLKGSARNDDNAQVHGNNLVGADMQAVTSEDIQSSGSDNLSAADIDNASTSIDSEVDTTARIIGFAQVIHGTGWSIDSENNGEFVTILWVSKEFDINGTTITKGTGTIKIGTENYNLNLSSSTSSSDSFDVRHKGEADGTANFNLVQNYTGLETWTGTLTLSSGQNYTLHFATKDNALKANLGEQHEVNQIKGQANAQLRADLRNTTVQQREGFWTRLLNFLKGNKG